MLTPTVTELTRPLEPTTFDTFGEDARYSAVFGLANVVALRGHDFEFFSQPDLDRTTDVAIQAGSRALQLAL